MTINHHDRAPPVTPDLRRTKCRNTDGADCTPPTDEEGRPQTPRRVRTMIGEAP